jgi:F0F1-type ATP synthase membrane subunit b/b'
MGNRSFWFWLIIILLIVFLFSFAKFIIVLAFQLWYITLPLILILVWRRNKVRKEQEEASKDVNEVKAEYHVVDEEDDEQK